MSTYSSLLKSVGFLTIVFIAHILIGCLTWSAGLSAGLVVSFAGSFMSHFLAGSVQGVVLAAILMTGCETGFLGSSGGLSMILVRSSPPESFTVLVLINY